MTTTYKHLQITPDMIRHVHSERVAIRQIQIEADRQKAEQAKKALLDKVDAVYEHQAELLTQSILEQLCATIVNETGSKYRFENGKVTLTVSTEKVDTSIENICVNGNSVYLEEATSGNWRMKDYLDRGGTTWVTYSSDYRTPAHNVAKHVLFKKVKDSLQRRGFPAVVPALYLPKHRKLNMAIGNDITVTIK